ncbi:integrase arm-type DNA-binding domain-containing protein [Desulfovibrio aerotolerans]|uniref:Integrase arm-type DNA-binding domain-containing protein n=1 Tax=Solidesulfovibrio aerotolerans TaxID=295255 RepID=A0A7C9IUH8_9BACT|nr:integrase arm-type DNA-binding domain-containing protein [Solidesulfovibrio aerotolerans]MYL82543.1 integrase arm-type DNA-binding domain-containing protein [Solidesulfovibrio aerotolerans]
MLTDTAVRNAKPGAAAIKLFDGGGLYLEVATAGGKWWRLKYRLGGKEKKISLGVYPDVSLKDARERRDDARKLIANGICPSALRKEDKAGIAADAVSFEKVAREWFSKFKENWTASHADRTIRRFDFVTMSVLRLAPMLSVRPGELRHAKWSEVDFDKAEWRIFEHLPAATTDAQRKALLPQYLDPCSLIISA